MTSDPEYFATAPAALPVAPPALLQPELVRSRRFPWRMTWLVIGSVSGVAGLVVLAALPVLAIVAIGRFLDGLPF